MPSLAWPEFLRRPTNSDPAGDEPGIELPRIPDHQLIRRIGRGGFGEVWLARDILGEIHAVKLLRMSGQRSAGAMQTEFEGLKRFTPISREHPGLVSVLHVGRDEAGACLYYVMELADDLGGNPSARRADPTTLEKYAPRTLEAELARHGRLNLSEAIELGIRLAEALAHLHSRNLVHRDIKPANIVFVKGAPKLADVGLVTEVAGQGAAPYYLGTPGRIAPEGAGTPAADVFSLGKVLYEAGLGMDVSRFPELPMNMIDSGAERELFEFNRIVMRACEVDVKRRFATAEELCESLQALATRLARTGEKSSRQPA